MLKKSAGADIKEMKDKECKSLPVFRLFPSDKPRMIDSDVYKNKFLENWTLMSTIRKPVIAAVSGYAV